jgi:gluconolactonase
MMKHRFIPLLLSTLTMLSFQTVRVTAQVTEDAPAIHPEAVINLATSEGTKLVKGQWRYSDAKIVEVDFRNPGVDRKASGTANKTFDINPHAGIANFDDSKWEAIAPETLDQRRCTGNTISQK